MNATDLFAHGGWTCTTQHTAPSAESSGIDVCTRQSNAPIASNAPLFPVSDASGNIFFDEQQLILRVLSQTPGGISGQDSTGHNELLPLLARLPGPLLRKALSRGMSQQQQACADGWSRDDFLFGRGHDCAVPLAVRDFGSIAATFFGATTFICLMFLMHRKRVRGETRTRIYGALNLIAGSALFTSLWAVVSACHTFRFTNFAFGCGAVVAYNGVEYSNHVSTVFVNHAVDTMFSMRPAQAKVWHGAIAQLGFLLRSVGLLSLSWGFACIAAGNAAEDDEMRYQGFMIAFGGQGFMYLWAAGMMLLSAAGTGPDGEVFATAPKECPVPLVRRGVSLAFLKAFTKQKAINARATTAEVCHTIVKPVTAEAACAYYDLAWTSDAALAYGKDSKHWTGEANFFLSHAWSCRFRDLVEIIECFEDRATADTTQYYWFDIFVMNQHSEEHLGQTQQLANLQASVRAPGKLLLAIDSWREPSPFARAWCLLEIFTAVREGAELIMCSSRAEQASFASKLAENQAEVQRVVEAIDARDAEAMVQADRDMVFKLIEDGVGFAMFNRTIRAALRASYERVAISQRRL
eukprot:g6211.t1